LTRVIVPRIGEQKATIVGLMLAAVSYAGYGLATEGWMIYAILVFGSLAGITSPSIQGLISRGVGPDEQGGVQGALASLASIAGIIGPPIGTNLFSYFINPRAPMQMPGAAFFFSSLLLLVAIVLAERSFRKTKQPH